MGFAFFHLKTNDKMRYSIEKVGDRAHNQKNIQYLSIFNKNFSFKPSITPIF
jgi:hypothetical protein